MQLGIKKIRLPPKVAVVHKQAKNIGVHSMLDVLVLADCLHFGTFTIVIAGVWVMVRVLMQFVEEEI